MIAAIHSRSTAPEAVAPQEDAVRLDALVREARDADIARRVLLVSLSSLPRQFVLPHHLRLARDAVEPLAMADRARVFGLPNHDLVVIWRGDAQAALSQSLDAVRLLFEDDAALLPDRLDGADQMLVHAHPASDAVHDDAQSLRCHACSLNTAGCACVHSPMVDAKSIK